MPSQPNKPDLDWSQIRETVLMLNLAVSQIQSTMKDGDESISTLAELFTSLMGSVQVIGKAADNLPDSAEKGTITANYAAVSQRRNEATTAFQFYDKLVQRLVHVSHSLATLADLIGDSGRLYNPYEWFGLQEMIKSKYTLEADKVMFKAILDGATVEDALKLSNKYQEEEQSGTVELF